jgi:hypothetical protein
MSKIVWDASGEKMYETGVNHGVLYVQKTDGTYDKGVAWNGLTTVTESPEGAEPNDLYADNIKYATLRSAETFNGTIEAYMYPDEFNQCNGFATPMPGFNIGQQSRKPFGFVFRSEVGSDTTSYDSDEMYKLHLIYNATASPSESSHETVNDSPDAATMSFEITTIPVNIKGFKPTSKLTFDKSKMDAAGKLKLAQLEAILFGTDSGDGVEATEPRLPSPDEVYDLMMGTNDEDDDENS